VIFAELPSIRTSDTFRSPIRRAEVKQETKALVGSGPYVAEANNDRACIRERAGFPTVWIISLLVLAAVVVRGGSASAEAEHKRMMIATKNCRSVANTFMIKDKNTRCSFLGQAKSNIFVNKCSALARRVEDSYVLA
jgi:hypothetical protein